jgi:hypothetical protein
VLVHDDRDGGAGRADLAGQGDGLAEFGPGERAGGDFLGPCMAAAARPVSQASIAASTWKVNRPAGVAVSMPCLSTTRSIPRSSSSAGISVRWRTERAIRDSWVTTTPDAGNNGQERR